MVLIVLIKAFSKTAFYTFRQFGVSESVRIQLKKSWAESMLETFGYTLIVEGAPPKSGAQVMVGTHISFLDIPVLMAAFPEVTFIAKDDVKKWPIIGAGATAVGTIFVNRSPTADRTMVRQQIADILNAKKSTVAVFPSGTTTLYEELPWKPGAFEIAQQAKAPIQLFQLEYYPMRESAYIGDDHLLKKMALLAKIPQKTVKLKWLDQYFESTDPKELSEKLRLKIATINS